MAFALLLVINLNANEEGPECWGIADAVEECFNDAIDNSNPYYSFPVWEAAYLQCTSHYGEQY